MLVSAAEEHIRNGHIPKRRDCPICLQVRGPVVRHHQHPTRFEKFGALHVDLAGPLSTGLRGRRYLLTMTHRLKADEESILIPWAVPIKLKSDAPKEIIK
eukprot:12911778-Prorocentrum_lima.AAC.1